MITESKSSASQIRKRIGLSEVQVYYKVQAPESLRLTGWITEAEYKEIKLLRRNMVVRRSGLADRSWKRMDVSTLELGHEFPQRLSAKVHRVEN